MAWDHQEQQRALGAAGACQAVAALLRHPRVLADAVLLEKTLRAVCVLCCHGITPDTLDDANEEALVGCRVHEGMVEFSVCLHNLSAVDMHILMGLS